MKLLTLLSLVATGAILFRRQQDPMKPENSTVHAETPKFTPFLWFDSKAEEAARFYCSIFTNSKVDSASPQSVTFRLNGQPFMALNGGPYYELTPAYSMFVSCKDQEEVDRL